MAAKKEICETCGEEMTTSARGRPRKTHAGGCARMAEAIAILRRELVRHPSALPIVLEQLESVEVDRSAYNLDQVRRARAAAFTLASRGTRLAPSSSGRYQRSR